MIAALLRRRRAPDDFRAKRLAVGLFASADGDRWPRRNRLPRAVLARLGHFLVGVVLGALGAFALLAWIVAGCPQ